MHIRFSLGVLFLRKFHAHLIPSKTNFPISTKFRYEIEYGNQNLRDLEQFRRGNLSLEKYLKREGRRNAEMFIILIL